MDSSPGFTTQRASGQAKWVVGEPEYFVQIRRLCYRCRLDNSRDCRASVVIGYQDVYQFNQELWEGTMKRRILLVDDEPTVLLTLRAIFEMYGFEVDIAASASEGIQKLESSFFHMVITDMRMETDTAGFDVIRAARLQQYDPAIAILTAYPELSQDWHSGGVHSLLVKPIGADVLLRQVEALLISHEDHKEKARAQLQLPEAS